MPTPTARETSLREVRAAIELPRSVHIKTPTRTFNLYFYFALDDDGRIWVKSIRGASPDTDAVAPDWCLLFGTGLPHDAARADFVVPRRITSIDADLDELTAVSDTHRLYTLRWFANAVFEEPTPAGTWADQHGAPIRGPVVWDAHVAHNRGWAIGRRTRSFAWCEDAGCTFDGGGGLSTYYILRGDGTAIAFFDPCLPPDFSHTIGGPERSTFIAESMAVSADTIFVINAYGELRTRIVDFDHDGTDSMFLIHGDDRSARRGPLATLAGDWRTHDAIPLEGRAQISSQLAIVRTGQHLRDRELRVAGYDRDRHPGYYFERIYDHEPDAPEHEEWRFLRDDSVVVDPGCLLDPADTDPSPERAARRVAVTHRWRSAIRPARRVAARDMLFTGALWVDGERTDVRAEVLDFHLDWSPARLRFTSGDEAVEVTLHTTEQWSPLKRIDPGHDGTRKELRATVELSTEAFTTGHPVLRGLVGDVLAHYHLVAFAWLVQATEGELRIESRPARQTVPAWPRVVLRLVRAGRGDAPCVGPHRSAHRSEQLTAAAHAPALGVGKPLDELTAADAPALRRKISHNLRTASSIVTAAATPVRQDASAPSWLAPSVLEALRYAARPWLRGVVLPLLPFRKVSTLEAASYARSLATNLPRLLARSRERKDDLLIEARCDLTRALMLIDTRIAAYTRRLAQLAGTAVVRPFAYFEDLAGFWRPLRFGWARLDRMPWLAPPYSCAASVHDDELFVTAPAASGARRSSPPGIIIDVTCRGCAGTWERRSVVSLRITPTHLERDFFHASIRTPAPVGSVANPFRTAVEISVEHADPTTAVQAVLNSVFGMRAGASHRHAHAELSVQGGRYHVSGDGFVFAWHPDEMFDSAALAATMATTS